MGFDSRGQATAVDEDVIVKAKEIVGVDGSEKPLFNAEQTEKLKNYKLTPDQMKAAISNILARKNLLSREDPKTWYPKRPYRAADNLFQVCVNPEGSNFGVKGKSGAYLVSSDERSLYDFTTIAGAHELQHVNQAQMTNELNKKLKIAGIRGKRVDPLLESGANFAQRESEKTLFGKCKPFALGYARAIQVLEKGGDMFSATRAFYEEKRSEQPDKDSKALAAEAADRVLRVLRNGGLNTWTMAYSEGVIVEDELKGASPEVKHRAGLVTCLDLVDQLRLHRYGLLGLPPDPSIDWTGDVLKEVEPYIKKALSIG
jgi:hypothetical protein